MHRHLKKLVEAIYHSFVEKISITPVGGGSINRAYKITAQNHSDIFVKRNSATQFPHLFQLEKEGLEALAATNIFRTPQVLATDVFENEQWLLLEWIDQAKTSRDFFFRFGEKLAKQHRIVNEAFGWHNNNYMGSVPQANVWHKSWVAFFIAQRLEPLAQQCLQKHLMTSADYGVLKKLYTKLPHIFDDGEAPALLHGDLWSGNFLCDAESNAVLIDPAVYYGHRCMDIAMTQLFGGFDESFYKAYTAAFPLPENHQQQIAICNLYPLLIHLLLFGTSYLSSIRKTLHQFV